MQLHEIQTPRGKSKKRVGRGGKRGTYSGRGQKGQKSRAGHRIRPAIRDLLIRIPKLRGFKNKPLKPSAFIISLSTLQKMKSAEISIASLKAEKILPKSFRGSVKILGDGELTRAVKLKGIAVSASARKAVEAGGGSVE